MGPYIVTAACGLAVIVVAAVGFTLSRPSRPQPGPAIAQADNNDKASQDSNSAEAYYSRGLAFANKAAWDDAIANYTEAIRLKPTFAEALCGRGYAYHRKGLAEKAIASLASSLGSRTAISTTYGDVHLNAAMADFTEAILFNPKYAPAYANRGEVYAGRGEYSKTIADCTEAILLDPNCAPAYYWRGLACMRKNDLDAAVADFTKAIQLKPAYSEAYFNRAVAFASKGDFDRCIADSTEAVRLNSKYADANLIRGIAYGQKGEQGKAISDYSEAIRLNSSSAIAYACRGEAYKKIGENARADADFAEAKRLGYVQASAASTAQATTQQPSASIPSIPRRESAVAYHDLGDDYWGKNDMDRAIASYTAAISLDPGYIQAYKSRAACYREKGDQQAANANLAEAERLEKRGKPRPALAQASSDNQIAGPALSSDNQQERGDPDRTKKAWESIEDIDIELRPVYDRDPLAYWEGVGVRYRKLNVDYVDVELRGLIQEWIGIAADTRGLLISYEEAYRKIGQNVADAANFGAALGNLSDNPQKGEAALYLVFGVIGAAAESPELDKLKAAYAAKFASIRNRMGQARQRRNELSERLSNKYGVPFHRRGD